MQWWPKSHFLFYVTTRDKRQSWWRGLLYTPLCSPAHTVHLHWLPATPGSAPRGRAGQAVNRADKDRFSPPLNIVTFCLRLRHGLKPVQPEPKSLMAVSYWLHLYRDKKTAKQGQWIEQTRLHRRVGTHQADDQPSVFLILVGFRVSCTVIIVFPR